jgi:predicted DNA-binding transcriptional regulator YafY
MEYLDAREHRTKRLIQPLRVRRMYGELTLVAHCHLRNERRHFKLERIVRLTRHAPEGATPAASVPAVAPAAAEPIMAEPLVDAVLDEIQLGQITETDAPGPPLAADAAPDRLAAHDPGSV